MHLSSITIKGFKSFPERTRLVFSPGVSVVVGPNGCGKSNITDAVLWALGEQSPLDRPRPDDAGHDLRGGRGAVAAPLRRGRGGAGQLEAGRLLGCDPAAGPEAFSEISIKRRLERNGEGEYRINGARCRLVDVIEVLADANLGREMHSVISQGRVEEIVHSKPRDRRLLVEEAAGLGKHRKRRRRAQLKLERTQENLDRALDVEREARSRLRPLKRQAHAAEIQARLEREAGGAARDLVDGRAPFALERARCRRARRRQGPGGAPGRRGGAGEGQSPPDRDRGASGPARSPANRGLGPADGPASRPRAAQRARRSAVGSPRRAGGGAGAPPRRARGARRRGSADGRRGRRSGGLRAGADLPGARGGRAGPGARAGGGRARPPGPPRWRGSARHPSAPRTAPGGSRSSWAGASRTRWKAAFGRRPGCWSGSTRCSRPWPRRGRRSLSAPPGSERRMLDQQDTDDVTAQLRACSAAEAELQSKLHAMGDSVTEAEVRADPPARSARRGRGGAGGGSRPSWVTRSRPRKEALSESEREQIEQKLERLARRRETLGPVNPLAEQEYSEALAHVAELEEQRAGPRIGAGGAPGPDPRHRPQDPGRLRGDLRGDASETSRS